MFSTQSENCIPICQYFYIMSLSGSELEEPKIGMWGKGLSWFTVLEGMGPQSLPK